MPSIKDPLQEARAPRLDKQSSATGVPRESQSYSTDMYMGMTTPGGKTDISMTKPASTANLNRQKVGQLPFRRRK